MEEKFTDWFGKIIKLKTFAAKIRNRSFLKRRTKNVSAWNTPETTPVRLIIKLNKKLGRTEVPFWQPIHWAKLKHEIEIEPNNEVTEINGSGEERECCSFSMLPFWKVWPCGGDGLFHEDLCTSSQQMWVHEVPCACEQGCRSSLFSGHYEQHYGPHQPRLLHSTCMSNPGKTKRDYQRNNRECNIQNFSKNNLEIITTQNFHQQVY